MRDRPGSRGRPKGASRDGSRVIPFPSTGSEAAPPALVTLNTVSLTRGGQPILRGLSLTVRAGGITALLGPNGAGKSLALRLIAGLIPPDNGIVDLSPAIDAPGLVFQRPALLSRSVKGNLNHALRLARCPREERTGRLAELLVTAGLSARAHVPARELSGGEAQRLAIARALAAQPRLLLMDEPTSHLDPAATAAIEDLTRATAATGVKIIFVTHDRAQAKRLADDVAFLSGGQVAEHRPAEAFFARPRSRAAAAYLKGELPL